MSARTQTIWTFVITSVALFMVTLDNLVVTMALPSIRLDLGASIEDLEWTVNAYTLTFAVLLLTGAALGDRFGRRRLFVIGLGIFTVALRGGCSRAQRRDADRRARGAGARRRDRDSPDPDDPLRGRAAREARARARRVGRHRRARRGARPGDRRRSRRRALVAVDLLAQRPHRPRARAAGLEPPEGVLRPRLAARPARPRPRQHRALRDRARARPRERGRLGQLRDPRLDHPRARVPRGVRPLGAPHGGADAADAVLPEQDVRGDQRRIPLHVLRDVRLDLPARAVPADRAGVLPARGRDQDAALDGDADLHRSAGRRPLRPDRRAAPDGDGSRAAGDRPRLARVDHEPDGRVLEPRARRS